jgi:hypothetical protein
VIKKEEKVVNHEKIELQLQDDNKNEKKKDKEKTHCKICIIF